MQSNLKSNLSQSKIVYFSKETKIFNHFFNISRYSFNVSVVGPPNWKSHILFLIIEIEGLGKQTVKNSKK